MDTFVIAGGNSGIGLQAARELLAKGHRVIILGRDQRKGEEAIASFGAARERADFLSVDLSTHAGVRDAAQRLEALTDRIDGLLHFAAALSTKDVRTADGLTLSFALNYLSRYHLTQLLLPKLLAADSPRVVMLTVTLHQVPKLDPKLFPAFKDFNFWTMRNQIQGACLYYADYLTRTHPRIFAGCATPGLVRTGIFRDAPWFIKAVVALTAPMLANSLETGAHNAVQALLRGAGPAALNWDKPGDFDHPFAIRVDPVIQKAIMDVSRDVTGV